MTTKNATATINATANNATKNATATKNAMHTVNDIYKVFHTAIGIKPIKVNFSDAKSQSYCGTSDFSVNVKKSMYYAYMSTDNAKKCTEIDNTLAIIDNKHDTTKKQLRCKLIKFTDYELMKKCIEHIYKVNTVNK